MKAFFPEYLGCSKGEIKPDSEPIKQFACAIKFEITSTVLKLYEHIWGCGYPSPFDVLELLGIKGDCVRIR